jgi:serine/threonine protein phosphatase PrpC
MAAASQTPDGAWRVEPYLRLQARGSWWYRLVGMASDGVIDDLSITAVEWLLTEMSYELADLVDVSAAEGSFTRGADTST